MTTFDNRENAFENRFVHDQDLAFRAEARRNRVVAEWAADLLGKTGVATEDYMAAVLAAAMQGGSEAVARMLVADLRSGAAPVSEHQVGRRMETELAKAIGQLKAE